MDILRDMAVSRGYFLRREALELGTEDRVLCRAVKKGDLVRIRQGAYTFPDLWSAQSEVDRHLARAHASQDLIAGSTALSHVSALANYCCPLWEAPLGRVHVTRLDGGPSRVEAGVVHHSGALLPSEIVERNGRQVTSPTRATLDGLTQLSTEAGKIAGDWMLNQKLTTPEDLWAGKEAMQHWPNTLHLEVVLRLLNGLAQSVGESKGHFLFWRMGLPAPELQFHVYDSLGQLLGITDFAWPEHGVYGEFDGRVKYGRLLKPGQDPGEVVFAEKRREDLIRGATGGYMVRFTWVDLHPQSPPSVRLLELLRKTA